MRMILIRVFCSSVWLTLLWCEYDCSGAALCSEAVVDCPQLHVWKTNTAHSSTPVKQLKCTKLCTRWTWMGGWCYMAHSSMQSRTWLEHVEAVLTFVCVWSLLCSDGDDSSVLKSTSSTIQAHWIDLLALSSPSTKLTRLCCSSIASGDSSN